MRPLALVTQPKNVARFLPRGLQMLTRADALDVNKCLRTLGMELALVARPKAAVRRIEQQPALAEPDDTEREVERVGRSGTSAGRRRAHR
jgi:hypothetical protein